MEAFFKTILKHLAAIAEYDHLLIVLLIVLLIPVLHASRRTKNICLDGFDQIEKNVGSINLSVEDNSSDLKEMMDKTSRGYRSVVEGVWKKSGDEIQVAVDGMKENNEQMRGLFEQQGVVLHDSLSELAAAGQKHAKETHQSLSALLGEQVKKMEEMQAALREELEKNSNIAALRDSVNAHLTELMREERQLQQQAQAQSASLISDSINRLAGEMEAKLALVADKVGNRFNENMNSTMQSFHNLQSQIDALISTKDDINALGQSVTSLSRLVLSRGGGGVGSSHLLDMLRAMLPDDAYEFSPTINGHSAAAKLLLPGDQGAVVVDNSVPLASFDRVIAPGATDAEREEARQRFGSEVLAHINHVADSFISPPATGSNALMFIASETAFAEIQAHHKDCINLAAERQVWMVSPTTLAAALNMARSALKDQKARRQLEELRQALQQVMHEAQNFEARLVEIGDHIGNAMRSVQRAENAGVKFVGEVRDAAGLASAAGGTESPALPGSGGTPAS